MEEFQIKTGLKTLYGIVIISSIIGIVFLDMEHGVKICFGIIILLIMFITNRRIILEPDRIIEKTLLKTQSILFSEIKATKIYTRSLWKPVNEYLYFLELEKKNNKKVIISEIYTYKDYQKIIKTLEKKTGKKVQIIKKDSYLMDKLNH